MQKQGPEDRENHDAALRLLLLAAEAVTYGQYDVARRRVEAAQEALAPLPDVALDEAEAAQ